MSLPNKEVNQKKGSHREPFFSAQQLLAKEHCWVELSRQAFFANAYNIKQLIGPSVRIAAMLKANAYGHGLVPMGQLSQECRDVDYMTVFLLSDAVILRTHGISKPILVLGCYDIPLTGAFDYGIDVTVGDWDVAKEVYALSLELKRSLNVHLKFDTGLVRLGFLPEQLRDVVAFLQQSPYLNLVGVFSHFAASDGQDVSFMHQQEQQFALVVAQLRSMHVQLPLIHIANTAATLRFPEVYWTMVRCGGLLYGTNKKEEFCTVARQRLPHFTLAQICTVKARVMAIKDVAAGTPIGYACTFTAPHPMKVAVVSMGYFDGYDRRLSNKGTMIIRGHHVPVIGRIAMNMTTVDITNIASVAIGDEVMVAGDYEGVRMRDITHTIDTIEYEIMTRINPALPRKIV